MRRTWRAPIVFLTAILLACLSPGHTPAEPETASAAEGLESLMEALNLDFEAGEEPRGWFAGGQGYSAAIDRSEKRAGAQSLRIAFEEAGRFGVATNRFPADPVRGRRLRLSGYIRTEGITTGWAGLWLRIDGPGGALAFDNMQDRGVTGTTDWTRYEIALDVPEETVDVFFGALLTGDGIAWIDSLSFELAEPAGPPPVVSVGGSVRNPEGRPVAGAHVALVGPVSSRAAGRARTDGEGRFSMSVPAGDYAITATAPGLKAAFIPISAFGPEEEGLERVVELGRGGFTIEGRVTDESGEAVAGLALRLYRLSEDEGDIFYTETDEEGRYSVRLIPGDGYRMDLESRDYIALPARAASGVDQTVDLLAVRRGPAPEAVVARIKALAVPLKSVEAGQGFDDMEPLRQIVGDARVVALGEATHGTREFFQLKHRMLEFLVERMGFTVFAIEANWPESLAINDYVLTGEGDAKEALRGIYFWTWNTEEVLDLIEWMRRYNADPAHETKIRFYGFDMQATVVAARESVAYLRRLDPERARRLDEVLDPLESEAAMQVYATLPGDARAGLREAIEETLRFLDEGKARHVETAGERAWVLGRQQVAILKQAVRSFSGKGGPGYGARDEAMAENIQWILRTEPPGTRVVAWAHNGHVSRDRDSGNPMGSHLADSLGDDYVALGFVFNQGSFQALDGTRGVGRPGGLREHTVGPAPPGSVGATFARTGLPALALDLRGLSASDPAGRWFRAPHPMRDIGAVFAGEEAVTAPMALARHFDGILFVDRTTRARPVSRER